MKKALITGITGQDDSYLADFLLGMGYDVHGIVRRASTFNTHRIDHRCQDPHEASARLFSHYGDLSDSSRLATLLAVNLYGPGDNFDPGTSHVIPALIRKMERARTHELDEVVLWDDGSPAREFLSVEDCVTGLMLAEQRYTKAAPINLGTGTEISIRDLATTITEAIGYTGGITWDTTRPNGQPCRRLDTSRASAEFGFAAETSFAKGTAKTVAWFGASLSN